MKIQYLGTAAAEGWPGLFCRCAACEQARTLGGNNIRTRSQSLIDGELLVDLPADTYMHMLRFEIPLPEIRHLIVTHSHEDHLYPDELYMRSRPFTNTPNGVLTVYGNEAVGAALEKKPWQSELFYQFRYQAPFEWFQAGNHRVMPMLATHDRREACYVYAIERDGNRIAYLNDTGFLPEASLKAIAGLKFDLISMDCTTGKDPDGGNHMGIDDIPKMMASLRENGCTHEDTQYVITHFSHNGGYLHDELVAIGKKLGVIVAYDGFELEV